MARHWTQWNGPLFDGHICSLGYSLIDWAEQYECHGPGDVQGEPIDLDDEMRAHIIECYRLDPKTGHRMYDEAVLSRPKGRAKSEIAGFVAVMEALAEVRFDGWDADGQPVGRPVTSPLIKCLATEESQAGNTFENVAFICGEWGHDTWPEIYDGISGMAKYQSASALYLPHGGEIRACTAGAASKDGGKETHVVADETHLYVLRELKQMYATVARNLGKRKIAEPWLHQTSTAYRPGEESVFEDTLTAWRKGELSQRVFVNHREAHGKIDLEDHDHTIKQLIDVYGDSAPWQDMERKYRDMQDPRICPDEETAVRYYLNRPMSSKDAWIPVAVVEHQDASTGITDDDIRLRPEFIPARGRGQRATVADGTAIALGFDGSLNDDSTVLIGSRMSDGLLFPVGIWSKPAGLAGNWWEVPREDVIATIRDAFARWDVTRLYADPHEWRSDIDKLSEQFGDERVIAWATTRDVAMAAALDRLHTDLRNGAVWHTGDGEFMEHFRNAYVRNKGRLRLVRKETPNSNRKIDSVVGATLAYEARADALTGGWASNDDTDTRMVVYH